MGKSDTDPNNIDLSQLTKAAVGYVNDGESKVMAKRFVEKVRVQLGRILADIDPAKTSPLGKKATPESIALMEYIHQKTDDLQEKGYVPAQASAIVLKDDLVPLQFVAGMANDSEMLDSVRKVNAHVISELAHSDDLPDPRLLLKRKKRGRVAGSGKKSLETEKLKSE